MSVSFVICVAGGDTTTIAEVAEVVSRTVGVPVQAQPEHEAFSVTTPAGAIWVNRLENLPSDDDFAFADFRFEISMDGRGEGHHERITGTLWPVYRRLEQNGHRLLFVQNMETLLARTP